MKVFLIKTWFYLNDLQTFAFLSTILGRYGFKKDDFETLKLKYEAYI